MLKKGKSAEALAWEWCSKYVRLRDCLRTTGTPRYGKCFTCVEILPFAFLEAGHYVQGRGNAVLFDERGINAQCRRCNRDLRGNLNIYRENLLALHGEAVVLELEGKKHTMVHLKDCDYAEIKIKFQRMYCALTRWDCEY